MTVLTRRALVALVALAAGRFPANAQTYSATQATPLQTAPSLPAWVHGTTCYEIFVRSFKDSNGDGVGDINGLISKLDYINDGNPHSRQSLGARCLWLMPIAQSPSYHGYDVSDYYTVEQDFGTNDDFKRLMTEAHKRGIRVLIDMVLNHSSSENPWFQAALHDTASPYRSWYRFSPTKPVERDPWPNSGWHKSPVRDEYYYGLFSAGMPDLNYETPAVLDEAKKIARFWLVDMGVDGFRLDAVPFLVESNGDFMHTAGTHKVLQEYEAYVRSVKPEAYTVGEVTFDTETLLTYYPEQLDGYFDFEVADRLVSAVRDGNATGMLAPALRIQRDVPAGRWSPFLDNHDQPRARTKLGGDTAKTRLASFILFTMPSLPFIYYGEEIGMVGDKPDPRLRSPMQWSAAPGGGFTTGKGWEALQDDSMTTTVAAQDHKPGSLLNMFREMIHLRSENSALADGELIPLEASDSSVAAYVRRDGNHAVLVVANLTGKSLAGVKISSSEGALPAGTWSLRSLVGGGSAAKLRVGADGRVTGYVPLRTLAPMQGYLWELSGTP